MSGPRFVPVIVDENFREACARAEAEAIAAEVPAPPDDRPQLIPFYGGYSDPNEARERKLRLHPPSK